MIVDIAIKVLSRAINDPTTAVLAIDQLHRLLRAVGLRHLHDDVIKDEVGKVRVVFRTPDWEDFVQLSCREIRLYGAENYQVARRLRAMRDKLLITLPEARHGAFRAEPFSIARWKSSPCCQRTWRWRKKPIFRAWAHRCVMPG